jgi:hypothetical protein
MSTRSAKDYPHLDTLVGAWLHQDFDIDGDSLEAIIASYKDAHGPSDWQGVQADILQFVGDADADAAEVGERFVEVFRPDVDPGAWGMSPREWLLRIHALLK